MTTKADRQLAKKLAFALYASKELYTTEPCDNHAQGVAQILEGIRDDEEILCAAYLYAVHDFLDDADVWLEEHFGQRVASLVKDLHRLIELNGKTKLFTKKETDPEKIRSQEALLRKMTLAMCSDLRVVLLRLASRLQTLRWFVTREENDIARVYGEETLELYAPLANRLGIWQMKWELEDLAFRFTNPQAYWEIARELNEDYENRVAFVQEAVTAIRERLAEHGIKAQVSGRPKHIYSIYKKMQRKHLAFSELFDVRAIRVIVETVEECYEALSIIQSEHERVSSEFDDYIAHPKPNGYQSLHTVILDERKRPLEIQIRTSDMHRYNELGVAAHWRYKESGGSEAAATSDEDEKVAFLRQVLAWHDDVKDERPDARAENEQVYVLTPQGKVVELPAGATPIDFAYTLHTELGHRCRGAKVNGQMVPLDTRLQTGQTVEVVAAKEGGPSRDWLNPELGFVATSRAKNKVRQYFNQQAYLTELETGRDKVEKFLARAGKSAFKLEELAKALGYADVNALFIGAAHEEFSGKHVERIVRPRPEEEKPQQGAPTQKSRQDKSKSPVLVAGEGSLLTTLAKCCHPAPPDKIVGLVTRGKGISVHRADCPNVRNLDADRFDRLIEVAWNTGAENVYPVQVLVIAANYPNLLKDVSEILMKQKGVVTGMASQIVRGDMHMRFDVEVGSTEALALALKEIAALPEVYTVRRV